MSKQCQICGDRYDQILERWFTPTRYDRIKTRGDQMSYSHCSECSVLINKEERFTAGEINGLQLAFEPFKADDKEIV